MKTLSKEAESRLLAAVKKATELIDEQHLSPNTAIVKTAREDRLEAGLVPLVVQAYNTGRTAFQRENSHGILDKIASFDLADTQAVLAELYPAKAEPVVATKVSADYSKPPVLTVKAASSPLPRMPVADYPRDPALETQRQFNKLADEKRALEEARYQAGAAKDQVLYALGRLASQCKQADAQQLNDWRFYGQRLFGADGLRVMDWAASQSRIKYASELRLPYSVEAVDRNAEPFKTVALCLSRVSAMHEKQAAYAQAQQRFRDVTTGIAASCAPQGGAKMDILSGQRESVKAAGFLDTVLGTGLGHAMAGAMQQHPQTKPTADLVSDMDNRLSDPQHEDELRSIRARGELTDFMANDDVLSGYPPDAVMSAFNEISRLAPQSSTQPAVMRALLRKNLSQGGMEPFEAKETVDIEKSINDSRREPTVLGGAPSGTSVTR